MLSGLEDGLVRVLCGLEYLYGFQALLGVKGCKAFQVGWI